MFALKSTNEVLKIITTTAAGVDVSITWLDMDPLTGVVKSTTETKITSATSTTVLSAPAEGIVRSIENVYIRNIHASTDNTITVVKDVGGTSYYLTASFTLLAGEVIAYNNANGWIHMDADGKFFFLAGSGGSIMWGGITGTISDQTDLQAALDGLQANLDAILLSGYITGEDVATYYVPYSGAAGDVDLGTTVNLILKLLKAKDSNGISIKNSGGDVVVTAGASGSRSLELYGHLLPDTNATRDLGSIASALKLFNYLYASRGLVINPTVNVSARAMLDIYTDSTSAIGAILQAKASQTANLFEFRDSSAAVKSRISNSGNFVSGLTKRLTTQFDMTSNATLTNITGLSVDVEAGKTYSFEFFGMLVVGGTGGQQCSMNGTCTYTSLNYSGISFYGAVGTAVMCTAFGARTFGQNNAGIWCRLFGTITVNAAGTLVPQFAQNTSNAGASSVKVGSTFTVTELN